MKNNKEKKRKEKNPIMKSAYTSIVKNIIIALLIMTYFFGLYMTYSMTQEFVFFRSLQVITMILLTISIVIFEIAYKKDSYLFALSGIETLILACHALSLPYILTVFSWDLKLYAIISASLFLIYFVFKIIIIYTSGRKEFLKSLSDIEEIVKEEKPKRKEATKKNKKTSDED